ncbi:MAG: hypothetical protein HOY71_39100, partial [Nonomuraea sp.]|nr:hypothetical protein [Nonomuraea sp.]
MALAKTPTPTPTPTVGKYTLKTKVVKKKGVSYLDVSVKYDGAARFTVKQKTCRTSKTCKTSTAELPVTTGAGKAAKKIGKGSYKLRGKPTVKIKVLPWPTRTVTATPSASASAAPTVTVTSEV